MRHYFSGMFLWVILISFLSGTILSHAYVASSSNYLIQTDSVNDGGGLSSSASYTIEDTLGESAVGPSASASYQVKAGYQQMQEVFLSVSVPGDITLLPNIPETGGGVADGSAAWTVLTDNSAGYTMNIRASSSPALVSGANSFPDYVPAGANPDLSFVTPIASSRFGFTPEGVDIVQAFRDDTVTCNAGAGDTVLACWRGLALAPITIASRATANTPAGTATTVRFRAASEATNVQPAGTYGATTTITVLAL
jgi:hypothetical protein